MSKAEILSTSQATAFEIAVKVTGRAASSGTAQNYPKLMREMYNVIREIQDEIIEEIAEQES